jgi:hypothetical protein
MKTEAGICSRCVLPGTFPGIHFNNEGTCNFCLDFKGLDLQRRRKDEYRQRFESILEQNRDKNSYDALMCYSGGKDSTYTLYLLNKEYGLRVLAVSFDNGFVSDQAVTNIKTVVESLGIDHIFFKPRFDTLVKIFGYCAGNNVYTSKALERASAICTSCMGIIKYRALRMSLEHNIPFIVFGWSPGQATVSSSVFKNNAQMTKTMQQSIYDPLYKIAGKDIEPYFLTDEHFSGSYSFPYFIHPLAFLDYSIEHITKTISSLGWIAPRDSGPTSTNCLLNSFANTVHIQRLGFHPYAFEMANLVREGYLSRDTALKKLNSNEDPKMVAMVAGKLRVKNPE